MHSTEYIPVPHCESITRCCVGTACSAQLKVAADAGAPVVSGKAHIELIRDHIGDKSILMLCLV